MSLRDIFPCLRKKTKKDQPERADYTAPTWSIEVRNPDKLPSPTPLEFERVYDNAAKVWLHYWERTSQGLYRPATIPTGHVRAVVEISRERSTSAESGGEGGYGIIIYAWSHTHDRPKGAAFCRQAACHYLAHKFSGKGNEGHALFKEECGC